MMKRLIFPVILTGIAVLFTACIRHHTPQSDVMMKAIANFEEVKDAPMAHGRQIYSHYCSVCHGPEGKGDGFNAFNVNPPPRNFTDTAFAARLDTALVMETILKGGRAVGLSPMMPPWGKTLSDADIRSVSAYVRYLATNHPQADSTTDSLAK